jgi:hypothetical protein
MWQKPVKKTIFLLNIDNYAPEITRLTYPLIKHYARKIGAEICIIDKRKFPEYPVVYEKLQIFDLAQQMENDWNIYIDSDAMIHPETLDYTLFLNKDTVAHNACDSANVRWRYDKYFRRDGRSIGSCNWFTIASDLCVDLWRPLDDITLSEALDNIHPTIVESTTVITRDHLIDDYTLSRNIARFGLKFKTFREINNEVRIPEANFFWHAYTIPIEEKIVEMKKVIAQWKLNKFVYG